MARKRHFSFYDKPIKHVQSAPPIFQKVGDDFVLTTERPHNDLTPDDYELDNLIRSGVDVKSKTNFTPNESIDNIDKVLGSVAETLERVETDEKKDE